MFVASCIVSMAFGAVAQTKSEAEQIRDELRQLKKDYQQRIDRLEERLRQLETSPAPAVTNAPAPQSAFGQKPASPANQTSQTTNATLTARQFANEQFQRDVEWR